MKLAEASSMLTANVNSMSMKITRQAAGSEQWNVCTTELNLVSTVLLKLNNASKQNIVRAVSDKFELF